MTIDGGRTRRGGHGFEGERELRRKDRRGAAVRVTGRAVGEHFGTVKTAGWEEGVGSQRYHGWHAPPSR